MTDELVAELFDAPDAQLIINRVQAMLDDEKKRRQEFYEWLQDDVKAEFINGEVIMHSPVKRRHLRANGNLTTLLRVYVQAHNLGEVDTEKALVTLTRNDYDRTADAAGHLFFRPRESSDFHRPANALSRARFRRGSAFRRHGRPRPRH